jgi:hypothetical protein
MIQNDRVLLTRLAPSGPFFALLLPSFIPHAAWEACSIDCAQSAPRKRRLCTAHTLGGHSNATIVEDFFTWPLIKPFGANSVRPLARIRRTCSNVATKLPDLSNLHGDANKINCSVRSHDVAIASGIH